MYGADGVDNVPHREWVKMYEEAMNEVKEDMKAQGRENEFIGGRVCRLKRTTLHGNTNITKIIYSTIRFLSNEDLQWYFADCIALKQEFPHLIAGFDLVGDENVLKPLIDYAEPLLAFRKTCEDLGLDIPFIFHAGETLSDGGKADVNLYDAIALRTKRIGHGFSLAKHPHLMDVCRQRGILVESCPIS